MIERESIKLKYKSIGDIVKLLCTGILISFTTCICFSQEIIPLWDETIPDHVDSEETEVWNYTDILRIGKVQVPTLEIYLPAKKNAIGKAVIICPGGGYQILAYDWEGTDIAKWFNSKGIAAFVLKYRLPNSKSVQTSHKVPLQDAQRAMRLVRHNSDKWNIYADQIGIMGFSAGGHLASTLGTHFDDKVYPFQNSLDSLPARPDFMILIYPVITMNDSYTHQGSKKNLLGQKPTNQLIDNYSNELHVNSNTPPTFIAHSSDDKVVPVKNSLLIYESLEKENIHTEMHIYPEGGHGYGLAIGKGHLQSWTDRLYDWLINLKE